MKSVFGASAAAFGLLMIAPVSAGVIYQSIPDLTVAPEENAWCSECDSDGNKIGQQFTLAAAATANSVALAVDSDYVWPTSITVGIYEDLSGKVGSVVYQNTLSSFISDVPTGNGTDVVTVDIGSVALAPGAYILFTWNPGSLGIPGNLASPGGQVRTGANQPSGIIPPGGIYINFGDFDSAVSISGNNVPEPSTWAMLVLGFAGLGFAGYRSSRMGVSTA
jgi:hypothetical protein